MSEKRRNDILKTIIDELKEIELLEENTSYAIANLMQAREHIRKVIYEESEKN